MLNRQACFEHAVSTIARQKAWSFRMDQDSLGTPVLRCLYRGADGCRCGVGALIDDADYRLYMECNFASCQMIAGAISPRFGKAEGEHDATFLDQLQSRVHDSVCYLQDRMSGHIAPRSFSHEALVIAARGFATEQTLDSAFLDTLQLSAAA